MGEYIKVAQPCVATPYGKFREFLNRGVAWIQWNLAENDPAVQERGLRRAKYDDVRSNL